MYRLLLALLLALTVLPAEAACLSPAEARDAVAKGHAEPLGRLSKSVRGEIVKAELCKEKGRYVYRVWVLTKGKVSVETVRASR